MRLLTHGLQILMIVMEQNAFKITNALYKLGHSFEFQTEDRAKSLEQYRQWVKACHRFKNWNVDREYSWSWRHANLFDDVIRMKLLISAISIIFHLSGERK